MSAFNGWWETNWIITCVGHNNKIPTVEKERTPRDGGIRLGLRRPVCQLTRENIDCKNYWNVQRTHDWSDVIVEETNWCCRKTQLHVTQTKESGFDNCRLPDRQTYSLSFERDDWSSTKPRHLTIFWQLRATFNNWTAPLTDSGSTAAESLPVWDKSNLNKKLSLAIR